MTKLCPKSSKIWHHSNIAKCWLFINNYLFKQYNYIVRPHLNRLLCLVCVVHCTDLQLNLTLLQLHRDRAKKMLLRTLASFSVPGQQQQHRNVHLDHRRGKIECKCPPHVQFKLLCWSIGTAYCHHWRNDFTPLPPLGLRDISVCLFIYGSLPFFYLRDFHTEGKKEQKV